MAQTGSINRLLRVFVITLILWSWNTVSASKPKLFSPGIKYPIELKQVTFKNKYIWPCLRDCVDTMMETNHINPSKNFILMEFISKSPVQFEVSSIHKEWDFTIEFYSHEKVIGYVEVNGLTVIVVGKKGRKYAKRGKGSKAIQLISGKPLCHYDVCFWRITIAGNATLMSSHHANPHSIVY